MDVEAQAAQDRNLAATFQANCTALQERLEGVQVEVKEWEQRCQELSERHDGDQATLEDLKKQIKEKERESEDLAIAMENLRLAERRREANQSRSQRKGILSWMFSFILPRREDYSEAMRDVSEAAKRICASFFGPPLV